MVSFTILASLAGTGAAVAAAASPSNAPAFLPLKFKFGGYPRVSADIVWGTPEQKPSVPTIVDTGSSNFWVYGPNATVNYGSMYHYTMGPCNITAAPAFDWPLSSSHTKAVAKDRAFAYGGNGKIVSSYYSINDTMHFGPNSSAPAFTNTNVAISNYTLITIYATNCSIPIIYDHSILGLAQYKQNDAITTGPSFKQSLVDSGKIQSSAVSMWFDAPPKETNGTFYGTALLGALPDKSKYTGELVRLAPNPPSPPYVGYYVSTPTFSTSGSFAKGKSGTHAFKSANSMTPRCLVDSGTGLDSLPISQKDFLEATGLIVHRGSVSYNGTCATMPLNATLDFTFAGLQGKNVTVKLPLRNYIRGENGSHKETKCGLSLELDSVGDCVLGATFFTGAFFAFNDELNEIAIAQGGVSTGARAGVAGLGSTTVLQRGQGF